MCSDKKTHLVFPERLNRAGADGDVAVAKIPRTLAHFLVHLVHPHPRDPPDEVVLRAGWAAEVDGVAGRVRHGGGLAAVGERLAAVGDSGGRHALACPSERCGAGNGVPNRVASTEKRSG